LDHDQTTEKQPQVLRLRYAPLRMTDFCEFNHFSPDYSIFDSGVYRILAVKWLFTQEKATFDALVMSTSEAKML
jgi:hypothetical protein